MPSAIDKYLDRYAEPERRIAERLSRRFRHVVVMPVLGEDAGFVRGLSVCKASDALCIVVVNAAADASDALCRANDALLRALSPGSAVSTDPPAWLAERDGITLLIVDRSSPKARLPARQGVGLARKIGFDLALALVRRGLVTSRFVASADADARLPRDYFEALEAAPIEALALCYPFMHVPSGERALDRATEIYELGLHYYVEGLRHARSPYAFHTIGSALAIDVEAYAHVRGFPKRRAGEDFHLLAKIAKLGPVLDTQSTSIRIETRRSDRVPFGTGRGVAQIEQQLARGLEPTVFDPRSFELLGAWLEALEAFAEHRDRLQLAADVAGHPMLATALDAIGALERAMRELAQGRDATHLRRRLHGSFGALPTLRLIHALRDAGLGPEPWTRAVSAAAFRRSLPSVAGKPQPNGSQIAAGEP